MIQGTNAAYLELSVDRNSQRFVSHDPGDCCCCAPPPDATSFENGNPHNRVVLQSAKKESITAMQHAFRTQKKVFVPPLQQSLQELRQQITTAIACIIRTLHKVCDALDYCLDISRVTRVSHIKSLWGVHKTLRASLSTSADVKFYVHRIYYLCHLESVQFFCARCV
jgi:hypothetical protein